MTANPQDNIFAAAAESQRIAIGIGRAQMARDVQAVIGSMNAHKPAMTIISELIALCKKEAA